MNFSRLMRASPSRTRRTSTSRPNGNSVMNTPRIISSEGKQDGLYWPPYRQSSHLAPWQFSPSYRSPRLASLAPGQPFVLDGYILRILTAQGDAAPGGAKSYIVNGKMTGGFAILATPVKYGQTGIMTFMSGSDGAIYEQDLGPDTFKIAASIAGI